MMINSNAVWRWLLFALATTVISVHGANVFTNSIPKLEPVPPCPALIAAAQTSHIPIGRIDSLSDTNVLRPGDSATVLVTLLQKTNRTQWLLYVEATAPDAKAKPKKNTVTVSLTSGDPITYESDPAPAKVRLLGPFVFSDTSKSAKASEKDALVSLDKDFLSLGLDQGAALSLRWNQMTNSQNSQTAFKPTPAELRIMCGQFPALISYVDLVSQTKGLDDLLFKLVELPSVWSMIRHAGMDLGIYEGDSPARANPADWNLPATAEVYYSPWRLQLNSRPALKLTLVVTRPHPPLLICSGVVGILAEKLGDDQTYMTLRLVNAHKN